MSYAAKGTVIATQTTGNCKENECDGAGNIIAVADNSNLPPNTNPCTKALCTAGVPSNPPLAAGTACAVDGGTVCNGAGVCGVCVPGAVLDCCGLRSEACCTSSSPDSELITVEPRPREAITEPTEPIVPIEPVLCCCGGTETCSSAGQWSTCPI
jgi:hypothetical protein